MPDAPPNYVPLSPMSRADVVTLARTWIGTPYKYQGDNQFGVDCLGLVRALWRQIYGAEPEVAPPYSSSWAELSEPGVEPMLDAARRHMVEIVGPYKGEMWRERSDTIAGAIGIFKVRDESAYKHSGVLTLGSKLIHAYDGHEVLETQLLAGWLRRGYYQFDFPGVTA